MPPKKRAGETTNVALPAEAGAQTDSASDSNAASLNKDGNKVEKRSITTTVLSAKCVMPSANTMETWVPMVRWPICLAKWV